VIGRSPISRAGSSSRKLPARVSSTSLVSCGKALSTVTARGKLVTAAMAMIFVPLPRLVGPTAKPPFSHSRRCRPTSLPPAAAARDCGVAAPVPAVLYSVARCIPIVENAGDRSDRVDTCLAVPATAPPWAESTKHHSVPHVCLAAVFTDGRAVAESAAAVLAPPTLRY